MSQGGADGRYRLECPRCAGPVTYLEGAAVVACPHCAARFFLGEAGAVGWLLAPRLRPEDAVRPAKRWLRENGRRATRIEEPFGVLAPLYWVRGRRFVWTLRYLRTGADRKCLREVRVFPGVTVEQGIDAPAHDPDVWEARGSTRAFTHAIPAHPLARFWPGGSTRLGTLDLDLLDPDELPAGFRLLEPALSPEDADARAEKWLARRRRVRTEGEDRRASRDLVRRLSLVAAPLVLVPYEFRDRDRGAVAVDAVTGRAHGLAAPELFDPILGSEPVPPALFGRLEKPALVPFECPSCGWELPLRERDRLHPCRHCGACWEMVGRERRRVRQWLLDGTPGPEGRHLPFWVFGRTETSARPPREALYVPAYAARHHQAQMHLAAQLTRLGPEGDWLGELTEYPAGAALGSEEAAAWRFAVRGSLARQTRADFMRFLEEPGDPAESPSVTPAGLVWIPFRREAGDLVEPVTGARTRVAGARPWEAARVA